MLGLNWTPRRQRASLTTSRRCLLAHGIFIFLCSYGGFSAFHLLFIQSFCIHGPIQALRYILSCAHVI